MKFITLLSSVKFSKNMLVSTAGSLTSHMSINSTSGKMSIPSKLNNVCWYSLKTKQCKSSIHCQMCPTLDSKTVFQPSDLHRKEVIQPHLPIRLPCYDFTPIIGPTFDGWLLAVTSPASGVADFRGVTGGVYKARERIHRSMLICDY